MTERVRYGVAWTCGAVALLAIGFLAVIGLGYAIARGHADSVQALQAALLVYARVVMAKGLLPALLLGLALWPLLDARGFFSRRGPRGVLLGLVLAAALASTAVSAALLPLALPGLPSVVFTGAGNFARTCVEMTIAVALAAAIPRWLLSRRARPG